MSSATFSTWLKPFLHISGFTNSDKCIPLPFQLSLKKIFMDNICWNIPLPFQICWNFLTHFWCYQLNWMDSISAAFSKLELFHEFLVISTEDDMFHYLFGFLKTFYTFLVLSIQTETLRYLFNFVETFFGYSTLSYHQSAKILGCILVTIKNWNYCSNSSTNNEKYWYV